MKKTLVIGSTVADVIINVPSLPAPGGDANVLSETVKLGGCAFNVSQVLRAEGVPYTLCSPVGGGVYGDFVAAELAKRGLPCFVRLPDVPNGCCYCIVDESGERTFLSRHGAEYLFCRDWMTDAVCAEADSAYVCGIELEGEAGCEIVSFLKARAGLKVFFAPGPRICRIPQGRLADIFALHPLLHLNEAEALAFTGESSAINAARALNSKTQSAVVVTLGKKGAYCLPAGGKDGALVPAVEAAVADTIGAGDAHCGAVIASLKKGASLKAAVERANMIAAAVVSVRGAGGS